MSFDFNDAEGQRAGGDLIPDNTVATVVATLRPGGAGDGAYLKPSAATGCNMLDFEFTIDGGDYDRRKFWGLFVTDGCTDGHAKAANITRSRLRAMLESARGVKPGDDSDKAMKARQIKSWGDLDGLRFVARIGVEKGKVNPQTGTPYNDKNILKAAVTPDDEDYALDGAAHVTPPKPAASAGKKPAWAQ